jgi:hypothetical protein
MAFLAIFLGLGVVGVVAALVFYRDRTQVFRVGGEIKNMPENIVLRSSSSGYRRGV